MNTETFTEYGLTAYSGEQLGWQVLAPRFNNRSDAREHRKVMLDRFSYDPEYRVKVIKRQVTLSPWITA